MQFAAQATHFALGSGELRDDLGGGDFLGRGARLFAVKIAARFLFAEVGQRGEVDAFAT